MITNFDDPNMMDICSKKTLGIFDDPFLFSKNEILL